LPKGDLKKKAIEAVSPITFRGGGTALIISLVEMAVDKASLPHQAVVETGIEGSLGLCIACMLYGLLFDNPKTKKKKKK
jgi:hypothetical protein